MRIFTAVVEKCPDMGLYVGYVPGFPGAHTQAETLDELQGNLHEVIEMLREEEQAAWSHLTTKQFSAGYSEADASYDMI